MVFRLIMALSLLAGAVLWLLSVIPGTADIFAFEHGSVGQWAGVIIAGGWAIAFILRGMLVKSSVPLIQRMWIFFGIGLALITGLILVEVFTWSVPVMPIVAVALALAFVVSLIVVGGRRWDMGDNEKANSVATKKKTTWDRQQEQNKKDN